MKMFFFIGLLFTAIQNVNADNIITALVLKNDSIAVQARIVTNTESLISFVNNDMIECQDGEYLVIKDYIFTGIWVKIEDTLYIFQIENPNSLMINTKYQTGIVIGLYCPLTPKHIVK